MLLYRPHDASLREAKLAANFLHVTAAVGCNTEQEVFRADVVILHALRILLRSAEDPHHIHAHRQAILSPDARHLAELLFQPCAQHRRIRAAFLKYRFKQPFRLLHERIEQMRRRDLLLIAHGSRLLRRLHRRQSLLCISFFTHDFFPLYTEDDFIQTKIPRHRSSALLVFIIPQKVKKSNIIFDFLTNNIGSCLEKRCRFISAGVYDIVGIRLEGSL